MEFIELKNNRYMIKNSNGYIITKEQKERYEKKQLNPEHKPCESCKKKKSTSKIEVQNGTIEETDKSL